jgi:glycosyltransferase involved in cell wall biosynthesis
MKIGFVTSQFGNLFKGGAEVQFEESINAIKAKGVDVKIIDLHTSDIEDLDLIHFFRTDDSFIQLSEYLYKKDIPYVVTPIFYPDTIKQRTYYYLLSKILKSRFSSFLRYKNQLTFLSKASVLYPNTSVEESFIRTLLPQVKSKVIPNCAEDIFTGEKINGNIFRKNFDIPESRNFILNVGRIEPRKNQYKLIQACKDLNLPLVLVGQIRDPEYWRKCQNLNYSGVKYVGPIYDKKMLMSAYSACNIFALPSTIETPGLSALEAYAQGAKILITRYGGTYDYFGDNAQYVDPYSLESIKRSILKINSAPSCTNEILISGYAGISYGQVADIYISSYQSLL